MTPFSMKAVLHVSVCLLMSVSPALAGTDFPTPPFKDQPLRDTPTRVSEHVWAIVGFPNIGIVVGGSATLVVDTGLGKPNGATAARVAKKLAPRNRLFLTTTHFHPEHVSGVLGFPSSTLLVRNRAQQEELDRYGEEMIRLFARQSDQWESLLTGEQLRDPDLIYDRELQLDLGGGVKARLLWLGAAHTKGDELVFVDPDATLVSGDVVQNKVSPYIYGEGGTAASWINAVEAASRLGALHVLPDHSPMGDGSLIDQERAFLVEIRDRALVLRREGISPEAAGERITNEFKQSRSDWTIDDLTGFVKAAYAD